MTNERRRPLDEEFQMPSFRLDNRVALITGGSRGLGLGMALALAHAGADVALVSRGAEELAKAAALIHAIGRQALTIPADVGDIAQVQAIVPQVTAHFGRLDILVNAAGINIRQHQAIHTEGCVNGPAGVVARHGEVAGATRADGHELIVGLKEEGVGRFIGPEVGVDLAVAAERGVEGSVGVVPSQGELGIRTDEVGRPRLLGFEGRKGRRPARRRPWQRRMHRRPRRHRT